MKRHLWPLGICAVIAGLLAIAGCGVLGLGASRVMPPPRVKAAYRGLENQRVGVMVWLDRGMRIDYPTMQLDTAAGVQGKLELAQSQKVKELEGAQFPVRPASIVRYQLDHPQIEALPITDVAPKLGVTRLIYIELESFSTRPRPGVDLYRGSMSGTIKVVEIDGQRKQAKIVYEENGVSATFPRKSPEDGTPNSDDYRIYLGTLDAFTTEVIHRFVEYEEEQ